MSATENPLASLISTSISNRDAAGIPIPKYMLAVMIHANSLEEVQREVAMLETDLATEYAGREDIDATSGRMSVRLRLTHPGQTQEMYDEQLQNWSAKRRTSVGCPSGCGCVKESDPDARECACDGPCTMDPTWPGSEA